MFKKKTCKNCKEKVSERFDFCPHCGAKTSDSKDYGMLGKNDSRNERDEFNDLTKNMFGGFNGKIINKMLGGAMKMLENEMKKSLNEDMKGNNIGKTNFELFINGKRINPDKIKVVRKPNSSKQKAPSQKKTILPTFDEELTKKFVSLNKKEPKTNIRRLSDKVIYELEIPEIKSIKDISIMILENSIEVKAVSEKTAYRKNISIDLPLKKYKLEKGKLILEMSSEK